jgi:hypothetical protein
VSPRRTRPAGPCTTLQLGGHAIAVIWVPDLEEREGCEGRWSWKAMRIELDAALTRSQAQEVLIHECAHAVSDIHDLKLTERQARALGVGLQQMLNSSLKVIR